MNSSRSRTRYDESFARELGTSTTASPTGRPCRTPPEAGAARHRRADAHVPGSPALMRAAIAGSGFIAQVHATALRAIGVEVVAVAGRTLAGAESFGDGTPYDDLEALFEGESVDVLHVCTPERSPRGPGARGYRARDPRRLRETAGGLDVGEPPDARRRGRAGGRARDLLSRPLLSARRADACGRRGRRARRARFAHGRYLCDDLLFPASGWRSTRPAPARHTSSRISARTGSISRST